jgi:hypothetical protein
MRRAEGGKTIWAAASMGKRVALAYKYENLPRMRFIIPILGIKDLGQI